MSYPIYVDKRPLKIAFLVSPDLPNLQQLDAIFEFNFRTWGGRFNPIILTDGKTIEPQWWEFLRGYDPDIIKSLVRLEESLLERIQTFLSPYSVDVSQFANQDETHFSIHVHDHGLSITPNSNDLKKWSDLFGHPPKLGIFNLNEVEEKVVKHFVQRNFGIKPSAITRQSRFSINRRFQADLDSGCFSQELHREFEARRASLSENVTVIKRQEKWLVIDNERRRTISVESYAHQLVADASFESYDGLLHENEIKRFLIIDRLSLGKAFEELSTSWDIVFPIQFCSFPNPVKNAEANYQTQGFTIVVGDTMRDLAFFWNWLPPDRNWFGSRNYRQETRPERLWLPTELVEDTHFTNSLRIWLKKFCYLDSQNRLELRFFSHSLEKDKLEDISKTLTEGLHVHRIGQVFTEPQTPKFRAKTDYLNRTEGMDLYHGTERGAQMVLNEPDVTKGPASPEYWVADVYIQSSEDYGKNEDRIPKQDFWWQLPRKNHLVYEMFNAPSRVNTDGFPSVLIKHGEPALRIELPDTQGIFETLVVGENKPISSTDPRSKFAYRPFEATRTSEKGRYLAGFLDVCSSLASAYEMLAEPHWRNIFSTLSGQKSSRDHNKQQSIRNRFGKKIKAQDKDFLQSSEGLDWLVEQVMQSSKKQARSGKEQTFELFVTEFEKNFADWHASFQDVDPRWGFTEESVQKAIDRRVELNILLIGFRIHCPRCGSANWYHIDEARQNLECEGCGQKHAMPVERKWYYRLNTLLQAGYVEHGLTAVILTLGQLLNESSKSFFFAPSLDLLKETSTPHSYTYKPIGDVDIVCIQDGKFIIGEVKQSRFTLKDVEKMGDIAERLRPNVLLFSSLDPESKSGEVANEIVKQQTRLAPLEIEVRWYPLEIHRWDCTDETIVYVTPNGKTFHRRGCRHLSSTQFPLFLNDAQKRYQPCGVCHRNCPVK